MDRAPEPVGTTAGDTEVALVPWPSQDERRAALAAAGLPRLLLLDEGAAPPRAPDLLEDWIRSPADPRDLRARTAALVRRMCCGADRPVLGDDGVLRFGPGRVAVPDAQRRVVAVLVDRLGEVVPLDDLAEAYAGRGGSDHRVALTSMLRRLATRVDEVGLTLQTVRGRGWLLAATAPCPLHPLGTGSGT